MDEQAQNAGAPVTYISIEAQMEDISRRNRAATAELEEMLDKSQAIQAELENTPPAHSSRFHWLSLLLGAGIGAAVVAIAATLL